MRSSFFIAVFVAIAAVLWVASGVIFSGSGAPEEARTAHVFDQDENNEAADDDIPTVRVRDIAAQNFIPMIELTGRTSASRSVIVRAEEEGTIESVLKEKGASVGENEMLAMIEVKDRDIRVKEAQEKLAQRRIEYNAAQRLENEGFNSRIRLAQSRAELETAEAALKDAQVRRDKTKIAAPFEGVLNDQMVEIGDYVSPGNPLFQIVDLNPIEFTGFLSERQVAGLTFGGPAMADLVTGERLEGEITFIASAADPETRTFAIEISVPNADRTIREGLTAKLSLPKAAITAHKISPSILTLNDNGIVGVKIVNADNVIEFRPVEILQDTPEHMWVGGLPDQARVITVGQEFVIDGQQVKPVHAGGDGLL